MKIRKAKEFVEENLKTVFAYSLSRLNNKEDAEDLTFEIVTAILENADKIKNDNAFYGYVWKIASNTYKNFLKKRQALRFNELSDNIPDDTDITAGIIEKENVSNLRREIALLSRQYRECTVAYYYDDMSCAQISDKFGISDNMVKYYLFKTRKILKEGICMERQFGQKSFRPEPFEFITIFSGKHSKEYHNLFSRKLPGQILLSAYYVPMSARELSTELGIGTVYLEDELDLLQKYNLITKLPTGKYLTDLVIFTDEFACEFYKKCEKFTCDILSDVFLRIKAKLNEIRKLCHTAQKLSENRLLWGILFPLMLEGHRNFEEKHTDADRKSSLYDGAFGINYGITETKSKQEFSAGAFAGYSRIDENFYAIASDFGILPPENRYFEGCNRNILKEKLYTEQKNGSYEILILSEHEKNQIAQLLSEEISLIETLYNKLFEESCHIMSMHAPKQTSNIQKSIIFGTLFFRTVGFIGGCAVRSKALSLPDFIGPAAVCIIKSVPDTSETVMQGILS